MAGAVQAVDDPRRGHRDRSSGHRSRGRHLPVSDPGATGRLPRFGPEGPPVRLRARSLRAHLKARQRAGPLDAGRGGMDRDPQPRTAQGVRGARPCSPRRPGRRRRCRTQARRSLLASAEQGRGLRIRPPVADAPEDPPAGTHRRRITTTTPPRRGNRLTDSRTTRRGAPNANPGRARLPAPGR